MEKQFTITVAGKPKNIPATRCIINSEGGKVRIEILAAENMFDAVVDEVYPDQDYDEVYQLQRAAKSLR